jgi:hypothetical protein
MKAAIIAIYSRLMGLYPHQFRAEFADEMQAVFALAVQESSPQTLWRLCLRECRDLPIHIVHEHIRRKRVYMKRLFNFDQRQELQMVRWLIRIVSLLACALFLYTFGMLSSNLALPAHAIPLYAIFMLTTLSLLAAWRWEVIGGRLTMILALLLGLSGAYATYSYGATLPNIPSSTHLLAAVLALIEWTLPFLIFGWLFVKVGRQTLEHSA